MLWRELTAYKLYWQCIDMPEPSATATLLKDWHTCICHRVLVAAVWPFPGRQCIMHFSCVIDIPMPGFGSLRKNTL